MKIALIVGAGFSVPAGISSANQLARRFLATPGGSGPVDDTITEALTDFWSKVFGADGGTQPTLEEHFTVLDLAANTGHQLGRHYPPRKLRAIRRLSIHRTFQVLDRRYRHSPAIATLLTIRGSAGPIIAWLSSRSTGTSSRKSTSAFWGPSTSTTSTCATWTAIRSRGGRSVFIRCTDRRTGSTAIPAANSTPRATGARARSISTPISNRTTSKPWASRTQRERFGV